MIDVVFLLLIFFIVTWKFSRDEVDLNVKVPTSYNGQKDKRPLGEIIINVKRDGGITIDGQPYTDLELKGKLHKIAQAYIDPQTGESRQPVRVRGDGLAVFERVTAVIDLCTEAGIKHVRFSTKAAN